MLGLKRSLLSQHASKLVHAGLAMSVRYGRTVEYSIDDRAVGVIREYIRLVEAMAGEG
jgi:DNA-binding transcriptional ArsR family regulator